METIEQRKQANDVRTYLPLGADPDAHPRAPNLQQRREAKLSELHAQAARAVPGAGESHAGNGHANGNALPASNPDTQYVAPADPTGAGA